MKSKAGSSGPVGVPPPQHNLQAARDKALEGLQGQDADQLVWLGATPVGQKWRLPILDDAVLVDVNSGEIVCESAGSVSPMWKVVVLHYLSLRTQPEARPPEITFATLPSARTYAKVHDGRVNGRLCGTVGRDRATLEQAAHRIGARMVDGGDLAFEIEVFPRVPIRLIWYAADEELPASCTLLLAGNIESFLCVEDIVVMSELFVSRLSGRPF